MILPGKQRPVLEKINEDMKFSSKTEPTVKKMASLRQRIVYLSAATASIALLAGWAGEAMAQRQPPQAPRSPRETVAAAQSTEQPPAAGPRAPGTDGTVVAIQPFQRTTSVTLADQSRLWLTDLNPNVRGRYLLVRQRAGRNDQNFVDIENPIREQVVTLGESGLIVTQGETRVNCTFRTVDGRDLFAPMGQPITPFCEGRLLARSQQGGYRTTEEAAVSLLRSMGGVGESLINIYKTTVGQDANLERAGNTQAQPGTAPAEQPTAAILPRQAPVNANDANSVFAVNRLSVQVTRPATRTTMRPGLWYAAANQPGVAISMIAPRQIDSSIMQRNSNLVHPLDDVESDAIVYLMGFDTATYTLEYRVGTDHPGVEWSSRPSVPHTNPNGPDGFDNLRPLARVGMVPPQERPRLTAVFVGGFKRDHGAFRYGRLSQVNNGSHYGFVENGVVLSRLVPGLSTMIGRLDGTLELRTWTEADEASLNTVLFARQNGMPIVEADANGNTVPGSTIRSWGVGNWSGALVISRDPNGQNQRSADLRTLRSGICMQTHAGHTWMIYAYFTAATPSAMARVFQAYGCSYAMMLDMNAPELTYAALYSAGDNGSVRVEHLNNAMLDTEPGRGRYRFLSANDNRDFFTVLRRQPNQTNQAPGQPAQAAAQPAQANTPAPASPPSP
jgi:hypothetical protein